MMTIARNAIYAATVFTLWPSALYAHSHSGNLTFDCPPLAPPHFAARALTLPEQDTAQASVIEFQMYAGRLRPQLERLLRRHMGVQHIVWEAADEHEWPSTFVLRGHSGTALIESLLSSYQLRLQLFANHSALITYLPAKDEQSRGEL